MTGISVKRILAAAVLGLAVMMTAVFAPSVATGQGGGSPVVGTWESVGSDGSGGTNHTWFTFGGDGSYQMVSSVQGGHNNGNVIQRWGTYQTRPGGQGQIQIGVLVDGGAPSQACTPGAGCTQVNIQRNIGFLVQVRGNQMLQGNSVLQRSQVPAQLQARMNGTKNIQGPVAPATQPHITPGRNPANGEVTTTPGLGRNCDDLQQQRICDNGNLVRNGNTGCLVCYK